jgi:CRISPR/Cas system CSM-associated protein Csm2 small subunit
MSEQELNSKMEFIVEKQAQFSVDIEKLKEVQEELTKKHNNLTAALTRVADMIERPAPIQETLWEDVSEKFAEMAAVHAETGGSLNNLLTVFERHIREKRNGNSSEDS